MVDRSEIERIDETVIWGSGAILSAIVLMVI